MGDAKRRGTFEERKAAAIAKQKTKAEEELAKKLKGEDKKDEKLIKEPEEMWLPTNSK
jgi:hypothetical protein